MLIDIDKIDVGLPLFRWLLGRMDDEEFRDKHGDLFSQLLKEGFLNRDDYLKHLDNIYEKYLELPILVEKYIDSENNTRYKIKDGHRRLSVIGGKRKNKTISCELWQEGWGKEEWEFGRLLDIKIQKGIINDMFPQKTMIKGDSPYNLWFIEDGKRKHIDSFLVYTGCQIPHIIKSSSKHEARGDNYNPKRDRRSYN